MPRNSQTSVGTVQEPVFEHALADIALGHEAKLEVRIRPTATEFEQAFGRPAEKLNEVLQVVAPLRS